MSDLHLPRTFQRDVLRAYQLAYYVHADPLISDYDFDMLERAYQTANETCLPVGSDFLGDYTKAEQALERYLRLAGGLT